MPEDWAKEQLNGLLDEAIEMAQKLIEKHGSHIPFGMGIRRNGERVNIAVDDTNTQDIDVVESTLLKRLHELCDNRDLMAMALARNVQYRSAQDGSEVDAIEVTLDHTDSDPVTCYLPYSVDKFRKFVPGEMFAIEPREIFFRPVAL